MNMIQLYADGEKITPDLFREMCKEHDLTYAMSSDNRYYQRGRDTLRIIRNAAEQLGWPAAIRIWNEVVDEKITLECGMRQEFYWSHE